MCVTGLETCYEFEAMDIIARFALIFVLGRPNFSPRRIRGERGERYNERIKLCEAGGSRCA